MKEGWVYKRFDEIMTPAKVERCGDRKELPVLSITMRGGIVKQSERFSKTIASVDTSNYKVVKDGQLVIAFPIDEGLLYTQDVAPEGIMSPAYNIWDVDYSVIDRRFLVAYFHSRFAFSYYKAKLRGSTQRRRSMDKEDLLSMPIPVPPLDIQQQILSELNLLSGVVEKQKAQIEELDKLAQSIFYDMFGDPVTNEKGWEIISLKNVSVIGDGLHGTPEYSEVGSCYFINGNNLSGGKICYTENTKTVSDKEKQKYYIQFNEQTIFVSINGSLGNLAFYNGENIILGKSACYINLKDGINKNYIYNLLNSPYFVAYTQNEYTGTTIKNISLKSMRNLPIPLPPLTLQQEFAAKVEQIELMKAKVRQSLAEAETLFNSRMDYYFN